MASKEIVSIPHSKLKESIAHILLKSGYISGIEVKGKKIDKTLEIKITYIGNESRIHGIDRVSKPSRRLYRKSKDIIMFKSGFGNTILSTPQGIMIDSDAKKAKVGGEILFKIW